MRLPQSKTCWEAWKSCTSVTELQFLAEINEDSYVPCNDNQPAITFSKLAIETLEQTCDENDVVLVYLLLTLSR